MNILMLAPHQDDELLGACLFMQECVLKKHSVFVAFMTNGDYRGKKTAARRYRESAQALSRIGVCENNIFCMGYADTGMSFGRSFLYRLFTSHAEQICPSLVSAETYHPTGGKTLHNMCEGYEAPYNRLSFLRDLEHLLTLCRPDVIIAPSLLDQHGDHYASGLFLKELLHKGMVTSPIASYLIHAGEGLYWPNRTGPVFNRPSLIEKALWENRVARFYGKELQRQKRSLLKLFRSQDPPNHNGYLLSFAKQEEFFLPFEVGQPIKNILP